MNTDYNVLYIEADRDMVGYLKSNYPLYKDQFIHADFLTFDLSTIFSGRPFAVIGNFPYNISSQIIFTCLEQVDRVVEIVGMFQLEMANRIISKQGSKDYGIISVLTQLYYTGEKIIELAPQAFDPPPKVRSAVIRLRPCSRDLEGVDKRLFKRIVKTVFGQRRKMLRKTLKAIVPNGIDADDLFFQQRPEQLSIEDFLYLTSFVENILNNK